MRILLKMLWHKMTWVARYHRKENTMNTNKYSYRHNLSDTLRNKRYATSLYINNICALPYTSKYHKCIIICIILASSLRFCVADDAVSKSEIKTSSTVQQLAYTEKITFDDRLPIKERDHYLLLKLNAKSNDKLSFIALNNQIALGHLYRKYKLENDAIIEYNTTIRLCEMAKAGALDQEFRESAFWIEAIALGKTGQYDKALGECRECLKKHPYTNQYLGIKEVEIGILIDCAKYDAALKECDNIINNYPKCRMSEETYRDYLLLRKSEGVNPLEYDGLLLALRFKERIYRDRKMSKEHANIVNQIKEISKNPKRKLSSYEEYWVKNVISRNGID